jgi:DNA-binding NarL/FixJ family response regulator
LAPNVADAAPGNIKIIVHRHLSLVFFPLHLSSFARKQLYRRLHQAYASGSLNLIKRIHALLALAQGQSVSDAAVMLALGEQTVRDYRNQYLLKGMASLLYKAPPGRPSKLTQTQRQQLAKWIKASPQDSG